MIETQRTFLVGCPSWACAPAGTRGNNEAAANPNPVTKILRRLGRAIGGHVHTKSLRSTPNGRRRLGALEVSSVGLGVQNMSRTYQTTILTRSEMFNIIRTAFDRGVTFYDAAEAYGPHEVERILGQGVAPFRDKVVIASKFGWNIDLETGERRPGLNSRPAHVKAAVEGMLKRLRTDRIDLLYQHRVDPEVPIEDVAGAINELMAQGKVLHWGLSEMGPDTLRRAHAELQSASFRTNIRCCGGDRKMW